MKILVEPNVFVATGSNTRNKDFESAEPRCVDYGQCPSNLCPTQMYCPTPLGQKYYPLD